VQVAGRLAAGSDGGDGGERAGRLTHQGAAAESELEDYWHELFKVQKLLVTKLRKAKADVLVASRWPIYSQTGPGK